EAALLEQEQVAVQDSTRYDNVVKQTRAAEAQRDSIMRQMSIIAAIDGERFVWAHVMDEVSRALPTYTWLRSVAQANAATTVSPEAVAAGTAPKLAVRVVGYTVNIQALTIFMKQLEASPFLENVTLAVSQVATVEGKQVTEFTVEMNYSKPPASAIRTVPLTIAVR
ncbi:MAG: PilN domain-containing protein, partial [Gemmatimonadetes bacterium]|nr:PilN domain-containing protein [Gemmatimonadota bacterium]